LQVGSPSTPATKVYQFPEGSKEKVNFLFIHYCKMEMDLYQRFLEEELDVTEREKKKKLLKKANDLVLQSSENKGNYVYLFNFWKVTHQ
jgi:hypothetical protein